MTALSFPFQGKVRSAEYEILDYPDSIQYHVHIDDKELKEQQYPDWVLINYFKDDRKRPYEYGINNPDHRDYLAQIAIALRKQVWDLLHRN
jgi:hypothetical protein